MQRATTDVLYFETGRDNRVTMTVRPGEEFEIETQLNRGPWIAKRPDHEELTRKLYGGNPSNGCICVEGAKPGDILRVHIGEFDLDPMGFTAYGGSTGAMPGWLGPSGVGVHHKIVEIKDGFVVWSDTLKLPVRPMLGFVGVAPARERHHNGWGGVWGGNFDVQEITTGAMVMLPVQVDGALLHIGDMHAIQGDGEICGAGGIEASGRVRIRVELTPKPSTMTWPRIETATYIATVGMARPCEDAFRIALSEMILWLENDYGFTRGEAYLFLGQVLEARCTQFVNPTFTYICKVGKAYLPSV